MEIIKASRFKKDFAGLPQTIQKRAIKQLALFFENPGRPSLRIKKIQGHQNVWEGGITRDYRFPFSLEKERIILRRIGLHNVLDKP